MERIDYVSRKSVHFFTLYRLIEPLFASKDQKIGLNFSSTSLRLPKSDKLLVQETFLRIGRHLDKLCDANPARAWLYIILRREQARHYGRKTPEYHAVEIDEPFIHVDSVSTSPERQCHDAELCTAIEQLPAKYRKPLLLQVLGGFIGVEIAKQLGITANTVMVPLFRAR